MSDLKTLFNLLNLQTEVCIVDVGANPIDGEPPYWNMLNAGLCKLIGFEPQASAFESLQKIKGNSQSYLPYALGDGKSHNLHVCKGTGLSSLLKPNPVTLNLFQDLAKLAEVVSIETVETKRLDDVEEISHVDLLKIDVQGSELMVLQSGKQKLSNAAMIQIEVSFVPLYENQPVYGEVDIELRNMGFVPHGTTALKKWPIAPCVIEGNSRIALNQIIEADMIYVKNLFDLENTDSEMLKKIAMISNYVYGSVDLALKCVLLLEERGEIKTDSANKYMASLPVKLSISD